MEIHLVRHPKVAIQSGICYGQSDVFLSDEGLLSINQINLANSYDCIYTSPLKRCTVISDKLNLNSIIDNRLMEVDFGDWELKDWNEIPTDEINPWYNDYIHVNPPNGESLIDLVKRVNDFRIELTEKHQHQKILLITHAGVIRTFFHLLLDIPLNQIFQFEPAYSKVTQFKIQYNQWVLKAFNL